MMNTIIIALGGNERGLNVSATILIENRAIMIIFLGLEIIIIITFLALKLIKIKGSLTFNYFKSNS